MPKSLTLSIVTANYNNSLYLDDFFRSIFESTCLPDEMIFVDDASTDNSLEILEKWKQKASFRVVVIALKENVGFANALNHGIKSSSCDLILRVDPDDYIHPKRIEKEKSFLERNNGIHLVGSNTFYYNDFRKKIVGRSNFPKSNSSIVKRFRQGKIGLSNGSYTARKEVFKQIHFFQEFVPYEEYVFFSQVLRSGFVAANIAQPLTYYRVHQQSRSFNSFLVTNRQIIMQRGIVWKEKSIKNCVLVNSLSSYLYWKSLRSSNLAQSFFYLVFTLPFKVDALFRRLL